MRIIVDLPKVIRLDGEDFIDLIVGDGMDRITINGAGEIVVHGNGGGAPSFTVDTNKVLKELSKAVVRLEV